MIATSHHTVQVRVTVRARCTARVHATVRVAVLYEYVSLYEYGSVYEYVSVYEYALAAAADIIERWQRLESVAQQRLDQSQQLTAAYRHMTALQAALDDVDALLQVQDFADVTALETAIFAVQVRRHSTAIRWLLANCVIFRNTYCACVSTCVCDVAV